MGLIILWMDPTYGTDNNSMHGTWYDAFALKTHTHPSAHALTPHTKLMMMIITKTKTTTTTTTTSTTTKKKTYTGGITTDAAAIRAQAM